MLTFWRRSEPAPECKSQLNKKQRSEAQQLAARLNGAKSKGPVTPEGKAVSSQNAVKHGFTTRRVVLFNKIPEAWDGLIEVLCEEWNPQTATELRLIHDLASARWRLNRLLRTETEIVDVQPYSPGDRAETVNTLGVGRLMFSVEDIDDVLGRLQPHGATLQGELIQYGDQYRLCYVRGPEGVMIALAQKLYL